jgi:D-alanyl-D-alanine dipeptidase
MIYRTGYTEYSLDELDGLNTRQLLSHLEDVRAYRENALRNVKEKEDALQEAKFSLRMYDNYLPDIKQILSTREHIPNKQEAKAIRQEKAKAKKNK